MTDVTLEIIESNPVLDLAGPGAALAAHYAAQAEAAAGTAAADVAVAVAADRAAAEAARTGAETAETNAETAQAAAEAARDEALDAAFNLNTRFAETSRQNLVLSDSNGLSVPGRTASIGQAFSADFSGPIYTHGLSEITFLPTLEFERAGTGVAIGGGASTTFAIDAARIIDGRLFIDGGGTNVVTNPTDFSNASWTKTNLGTPAAADGPAGTGTAWSMAETTTNGLHGVSCSITGLSSYTRFVVCALVKVTGRDYLEFDLVNGGNTSGVRGRYSLLSGGSLVSPYPAEFGTAGITAKDAGIIDYGGGFWLIWQTCTLAAGTTGLRANLKLMSASGTSSYAGDTAKGMIVAAIWAQTGTNTPVNYLTGTRVAETFKVPLGEGYYATRIVDGRGEVNGSLAVTTLGQRWQPLPRTGGFWLRSAEAYVLSAYDTVTRADTSAGSLGTATDGGSYTLLKNPGSFPMVAATNGQVTSNAFQFTPSTGANGAVYAVRDMGNGVVTRYLSAEVAWDSDTGTTSNTAFALLTSNSLTNLTERMPIHCIISRTDLRFQYRGTGGSFTTIGVIKPLLGSVTKDGSWNTVVIAVQGNKAKITWAGVSIIVQNDILLELTKYACWELYSDQSFGANTDKVKGRNLLAAVSEVGADLTYTAAAPVNVVLPFASGTAVAGNTYSAASTQGGWTSNNGAITYTYQWQFNGVDIPGATNSTLVTVNNVDEGKTVSVKVTATNASGSTTATSLPSAALA